MKQKGFQNVKRLKHGIIGYERFLREQQRAEESLFNGKNFLFDKRRLES